MEAVLFSRKMKGISRNSAGELSLRCGVYRRTRCIKER